MTANDLRDVNLTHRRPVKTLFALRDRLAAQTSWSQAAPSWRTRPELLLGATAMRHPLAHTWGIGW